LLEEHSIVAMHVHFLIQITVRCSNNRALVINLLDNVHTVHSLCAFRTLRFSDWVSVRIQVWNGVRDLLEIWVIPVRESGSVSYAQHCRFLNSLPHLKGKVSNLMFMDPYIVI